jgi:hypothetical protein
VLAVALVRAALVGSVGACAETCGVSEEAMHRRLYNPGLRRATCLTTDVLAQSLSPST